MADTDPVLRLCGAVVRCWRQGARLTTEELAAKTNYALDTIASIESGRRSPSARFLAAAEDVLGAHGSIAVMEKHVRHRARGLLAGELAEAEQRATALDYFAPCVMPMLLRTEGYAKALRDVIAPLPGVVEEVAEERRNRQAVLERSVPITFVIDQSVLYRPIGGQEVLREQLLSVADIARRPHVTVQVMSWDSEDYAGLVSALALVRADGETLVCFDSGVGVQWVGGPGAERLSWQYVQMRAQALSPRASLDVIEKAIADL